MEVFNTANYLEKVSGLADMLENTDFNEVITLVRMSPNSQTPSPTGRPHLIVEKSTS